MIKNLKQRAVIALIIIWLGWHLSLPVDLIRSDLGRHIKNGELILQGNWDVLYKNFYSYTDPEFPFINHHWFFGVLSFIGWHYLGFTGLSIIYLILELFTFYLFFSCWRRYSSFTLACACALFSFPFITLRSEVRPEGFSYLFCALFWWMIDRYQQKRLKPIYLIVGLCLIQVIWVNVHIFFIIGPVLAAFWWGHAFINKEEEQQKVLGILFFFLLGMCLFNPSGIYGVLAPFHFDKLYSYRITEDLSVFYSLSSDIFPDKPLLIYFLGALGGLLLALFFLIRKEGFKKYIFIISITLLLSFVALIAIRMIGLFGYCWIPLSMAVLGGCLQSKQPKVRKKFEIVLLILGAIVSATVNVDWKQSHGFGISSGVNDAASFFKQAKITGPIFNNYSIGGYLIFHLSPEHKFFVDNRLEAFPEDFFNKTFIPMRANDDIWHQLDQRYHFNVIFYSPDMPDWNGGFIYRRLMDPSWALVFHNDEAVIFLKCNAQNSKLFAQPLCHNYIK